MSGNALLSRKSIAAVVVILGAVLPYLNCLTNDFVWDDRPLIVQDYHLRSPRHMGAIFTRDFFSHSDEEVKYGYYRPLITLSYMGDLFLWGLNPAGFHLTNLLFHIANSWMVYLLAVRLFPSRRVLAAGTALLFAVHPVHVESVAWIAGRTDVICVFFFLLAFLLSMAGDETAGRRSVLFLPLSLASLLLALLAKETAVVFPLIVFVYEYIRRGENFGGAMKKALPSASIVTLYLVLRFFVARVEPGPKGAEFPLVLFLSMLKAFWLYCLKLVWPVGLSAYIQNPYLPSLLRPVSILLIMISLLLVVCLWRIWRSRPALAFAGAAFLVSFLPMSNVIRISAPSDMGFPMAERFLYLPSVFFLLFAAGFLRREISSRTALLFGLSAVALCWGLITFQRNRVWSDDGVLFRAALVKSPDAPLLLVNLGRYYCRRGLYEEGIDALERAEEVQRETAGDADPNYMNDLAVAYRLAGRREDARRVLLQARYRGRPLSSLEYNRGMVLLEEGRLADARRAFLRALDMRPHSIDAWAGLGRTFQAEGRYDDAASSYREALALFPDSAELHNRLGMLYREEGEYAKALEEYADALRLDSRHAPARANRGVVYALLDDLPAAREDLETAVEMQPSLLDARNALGMVYAKLGLSGRARETFDDILEVDPGNLEARLNRGILLYKEGDFEEARREFEEVLAREPEHERACAFIREMGEQGK